MSSIIEARGVGKKYRLGERGPSYGTLGDTLSGLMRRKPRVEGESWMWALKDVSFDVAPGEAVALIGRNGAGKSTLLKVLSRITTPTVGQIALYGRVASLLEVGTGFHGELSGRENVFLNGAVLGMRRHEIERKFDEIVAFSEVERFLDTPVKRYSVGMMMKLGFAVAAHLEPEILIVDEVLAVGDQSFQRKCLGKMRDVAGQGRTVLFVSHQMQAVTMLTTRAILLSGGRVVQDGPTGDVVSAYLRTGLDAETLWTGDAHESEPRITRVEVITTEPAGVSRHGELLEVQIDVTTPRPMRDAGIWLQACNDLEQAILWTWNTEDGKSENQMAPRFGSVAGLYSFRCVLPRVRLYQGRYTVNLTMSEGTRPVHQLEGLCPFEIVMWGMENPYSWHGRAATYLDDTNWQCDFSPEVQ